MANKLEPVSLRFKPETLTKIEELQAKGALADGDRSQFIIYLIRLGITQYEEYVLPSEKTGLSTQEKRKPEGKIRVG